jgi:hypothetical protein
MKQPSNPECFAEQQKRYETAIQQGKTYFQRIMNNQKTFRHKHCRNLSSLPAWVCLQTSDAQKNMPGFAPPAQIPCNMARNCIVETVNKHIHA